LSHWQRDQLQQQLEQRDHQAEGRDQYRDQRIAGARQLLDRTDDRARLAIHLELALDAIETEHHRQPGHELALARLLLAGDQVESDVDHVGLLHRPLEGQDRARDAGVEQGDRDDNHCDLGECAGHGGVLGGCLGETAKMPRHRHALESPQRGGSVTLEHRTGRERRITAYGSKLTFT
jgi:hypothetical protein